MTKIKAIIWDMDGVLIDSESHHADAEIETFRRFGFTLTKEANLKYSGMKVIDHFEDLLKFFKSTVKVEQVLALHRETIKKYAQEIFPLAKNAIQTLSQLDKDYKMSLATSSEKEMVEIIFNRFSLKPYFDEYIVGEDVKNSKPDPEPFLKAAEKLGVLPDEVVGIEDSMNGMKAVKAAGMKLIARKAKHNRHLDFSLADFVIFDLKEIPDILERINSKL